MTYDALPDDVILASLSETMRTVENNWAERQSARRQRGDNPTPGEPSITVTVDTEHRTYNGRVFTVAPRDGYLDLYDLDTTTPRNLLTAAPTVIRAEAIVAARVKDNVDLLPVEFPMKATDLHTHVANFITQAAAILADPDHDEDATTDPYDVFDRLSQATGPTLVTTDQCQALRDAAEPVNSLMSASPIPTRWDRYAHGLTGQRTLHALDDDPHLNVTILNRDDPKPGPTTLLNFLTYGAPLNFLYPETHQQALDAYRSQVQHEVTARTTN